jgi:general secretion pathway protein G
MPLDYDGRSSFNIGMNEKAGRFKWVVWVIPAIVVLVALLGAELWPLYVRHAMNEHAQQARVAYTLSALREVVSAVNRYKTERGAYPRTLLDLRTRPEVAGREPWPEGGYLKRLPLDGWGREFVYRLPGTRGRAYDIVSYGADGKPGGEAADLDLEN